MLVLVAFHIFSWCCWNNNQLFGWSLLDQHSILSGEGFRSRGFLDPGGCDGSDHHTFGTPGSGHCLLVELGGSIITCEMLSEGFSGIVNWPRGNWKRMMCCCWWWWTDEEMNRWSTDDAQMKHRWCTDEEQMTRDAILREATSFCTLVLSQIHTAFTESPENCCWTADKMLAERWLEILKGSTVIVRFLGCRWSPWPAWAKCTKPVRIWDGRQSFGSHSGSNISCDTLYEVVVLRRTGLYLLLVQTLGRAHEEDFFPPSCGVELVVWVELHQVGFTDSNHAAMLSALMARCFCPGVAAAVS